MDVLEKVQDIVKAASDKTSEIIEVSRLKAGIAEERRALTDQMAKLGAIYYELYKNGEVLTPDAVNICMIADKYSTKIESRQAALTRHRSAPNRSARSAAARTRKARSFVLTAARNSRRSSTWKQVRWSRKRSRHKSVTV